MAALPHKSGLYRAYKKINGREYQAYFPTLKEAEARQLYFESLSNLKSRKLFYSNGSLVGVSLCRESRGDRQPYISVRIQIEGKRKSFIYKGDTERSWKIVVKKWKEFRRIDAMNFVSFRHEIKLAKIAFIRDIGRAEAWLETQKAKK